jgi:membrane fusion protein (multidrug efflux system)
MLAAWALAGLIWPATELSAQPQDSGPPPGSVPGGTRGAAAAAPADLQQAVIERMPLVTRNPQTYQVPLRLDPVTSVDLVAPLDGVVNNISVKPGDKIAAQAEAARLESTERQLELDRARAEFQLAQLEQESAGSDGARLAAARLDVAKFGLQLAQHRLDQTTLRAPFSGTITRVHVVPGQFVRAGQALATLADLTRLAVEMPIDRKSVNAGDSLSIKVEDATVNAQVEAILPLADRFEPLRDLFLSIASGRLLVDNATGQFQAGQTVYSDMIPRHPVVEAPTTSIGNSADGQRKVQVIREGFVRDVPVQLLGQSGDTHVFVTGRFGPTDELVVKTSVELLDGTRAVQATEAATAAASGGPTGRPRAQGASNDGF